MLIRDQIGGGDAGIKLVESAPREKGVLARYEGVFSVCDIKNRNGRIYERGLWEDVLGKKSIQEALRARTLLGEADHPQTRTESVIKDATHTITNMHLDEDGRVRGEVALFDCATGRLLHNMLQAGVKLGFSTRGDGDLQEDEASGAQKVVKESYEFCGTDFVLNPSFVEAGPISEAQRKTIRKSLTEAVESKHIDKALQEQAEQILTEATVKEEPKKDGEEEVEATEVVPEEAPETASASAEEEPVEKKDLEIAAGDDKTVEVVVEEGVKEAVDLNKLDFALNELLNEFGHMGSNEDVETIFQFIEKRIAAERESADNQMDPDIGDEAPGAPGARASHFGHRESAKLPDVNQTLMDEIRDANFKVADLEEEIATLKKSTKTSDAVNEDKAQLKKIMKENQDTHLKSVGAHKKTETALETKVKTATGIIEELKTRLTNMQTALKEAQQKIKTQKAESEETLHEVTLKQYKTLKTEGHELPVEFKTLLERSETEAEVDTILEHFHTSQAYRYSDLPVSLHSRRSREETVRALDESTNESSTKEDGAKDEEAEDTQRLAESQL